jgi:hypothetical protein
MVKRFGGAQRHAIRHQVEHDRPISSRTASRFVSANYVRATRSRSIAGTTAQSPSHGGQMDGPGPKRSCASCRIAACASQARLPNVTAEANASTSCAPLR